MLAKRHRLSLGTGFSVREDSWGLAAGTGREVPYVNAGDPAYLVADPSAATDAQIPAGPVRSPTSPLSTGVQNCTPKHTSLVAGAPIIGIQRRD